MHISTSAIYLILLSLLGGSKTAHAEPSEDAFGVSNYGILCQDRIYPKYVIYAAAKNYCDIMKKIPSFGDRTSKGLGFQTRFYYYFSSKTPINNLLKTSHHIVPIFEDGTLYPLEADLRKNSAGKVKMDKRDPGPDRLVIDVNCDIIGAFTDFSYTPSKIENRIEECRIIKSAFDRFRSWASSPDRSPQQSPQQSPQRSRDHSPERVRDQSPERARDQSPERARDQSPERARDQSPERIRDQSPERARDQSPERFPQLSRQKTRYHSADRFPDIPLE